MNKYYTNENVPYNQIEGMLMPDESMIWQGTPKRSAFILNSSIKMMPFAILWLLFDGFFISVLVGTGAMGSMLWFLIPFFLLHLLPVWLWLSNVLTANARWKNTEYAVTDKRILIRNGLIGYQYNSIYYTDISNVSLRVGVIDRMLGVGDILFSLSKKAGQQSSTAILDVEDPQRIFGIIQKTVMDIQTDIHYPNALRPDSNPGYHTQYRP